jgi:hypothetical protein
MRKTDAAEAILSLTTSRDHAASIAGDLVQQAPLKGTIWFWGSLVGTTASLTWKAFTEAPLRITGLGLVGLLVQIFYMILIEVPLVLLRLGLAMKRLTVAREPTAGFETTVNSPALGIHVGLFVCLVSYRTVGCEASAGKRTRRVRGYMGHRPHSLDTDAEPYPECRPDPSDFAGPWTGRRCDSNRWAGRFSWSPKHASSIGCGLIERE